MSVDSSFAQVKIGMKRFLASPLISDKLRFFMMKSYLRNNVSC